MSSKGGKREGAGRPAGATNKRSQAIADKLEELNCDPIEGMAMIMNDTSLDHSLRLAAMKELAQYVAPKRKAVDIDATVDGSVNIQVVKFADLDDSDNSTT